MCCRFGAPSRHRIGGRESMVAPGAERTDVPTPLLWASAQTAIRLSHRKSLQALESRDQGTCRHFDVVDEPHAMRTLLSLRRRGLVSSGSLTAKKPEQRLRNDAGFGTPFLWGYFGEL